MLSTSWECRCLGSNPHIIRKPHLEVAGLQEHRIYEPPLLLFSVRRSVTSHWSPSPPPWRLPSPPPSRHQRRSAGSPPVQGRSRQQLVKRACDMWAAARTRPHASTIWCSACSSAARLERLSSQCAACLRTWFGMFLAGMAAHASEHQTVDLPASFRASLNKLTVFVSSMTCANEPHI
jgi:hypothetical protein